MAFSKDSVYYEIMTSDASDYNRPYLYEWHAAATSALENTSTNDYQGKSSGQILISMAHAEAAKEIQLLNRIFGANLNIQLKTAEDVRQLVDAINRVFHFKTVLERNKAMITSDKFSKEIKGVFSWFPTYFNRALSQYRAAILSSVKSQMLANHSLPAGEAGKIALEKFLPKITMKATEEMFGKAKTEKGVDDKYQQAYRKILDAIQQDFYSGRGNIFLSRLTDIYGLNLVGEELKKAITGSQGSTVSDQLAEAIRIVKRNFSTLGGENIHTKGGYTLEALIDQVIGMTAQGINNTKMADGGTITAFSKEGFAKLNTRPDNVMTFNVPSSYLDDTEAEIIRNQQENKQNRITDAEAIQKLSARIGQVQDGFIVYFNDKNYAIGAGHGHQAASNVSLESLSSILAGSPITDINQLIYNILQMGGGAISEGNDNGASDTIAQAVAYFLFDDWSTIGTKSSNGQSIHIMGLEGMMVPLSAFLFAMGTAIQEAQAHVSGFARATITAPSISFGKGVKDSRGGGARFYIDNWNKQYNTAMQKTRIKVEFLQNMQTFVRGYL